MTSKIVQASSLKKLIVKIDQELKNGFVATLGFIYLSPKFNIKKLSKKISKYDFLIIGATTVGEVYATKEDGINESEESLVCMLLDISLNAIASTFLEAKEDDAFKVGEYIGKWAKSHFTNCAIMTLTSGLSFDNDAYTQGIVSKNIDHVFGAAAGDNMQLKETFIFSNEYYSNEGVVAIAFDQDKINVIGSRAFGWHGIGKERIVSKAYKNIVYEIDGFPAIEFYKNYLDISSDDMPQVGIEYPLEVTMRNGQIVYRAVLDINEEEGSLIFAGHVEEKSRVRISAPRGRSIIQNVEESIQNILDKEEYFTPDVSLVFPCCSRKQVLGHITHLEIEAVYRQTQAPLIGFYAYGEIGAFPGGYGFHNETFVTVFLEEKGVK